MNGRAATDSRTDTDSRAATESRAPIDSTVATLPLQLEHAQLRLGNQLENRIHVSRIPLAEPVKIIVMTRRLQSGS